MAKTPQEMRGEADKAESDASDEATRLRDKADKQEAADTAKEEADKAQQDVDDA